MCSQAGSLARLSNSRPCTPSPWQPRLCFPCPCACLVWVCLFRVSGITACGLSRPPGLTERPLPQATFLFLTDQLMDIRVVLRTFTYKSRVDTRFQGFRAQLWRRGDDVFDCLGAATLFHGGRTASHSASDDQGLQFLHSLTKMFSYPIFCSSHSSRYKVVSHCEFVSNYVFYGVKNLSKQERLVCILYGLLNIPIYSRIVL